MRLQRNSRRRFTVAFALATSMFGLLAFGGCVERDKVAPEADPSEDTSNIGVEGGTVQDPSGFEVVIPAGAVDTPITVTIESTQLPYELPAEITGASTAFRVNASNGKVLEVPAEIVFPTTGLDLSTPGGLIGVYRWDGLLWTHVGGILAEDERTIVAKVKDFSVFVVGTGTSLFKPVEFRPHFNTYKPVVSVAEYRLARSDISAPVGNVSVAVFPPPFDNGARMLLPQGDYCFCYDWTKGETDTDGNLIYYYRIIGELPNHPVVSLNENSSDLVPVLVHLDTFITGIGRCPDQPTRFGQGDPVDPSQATVSDFVGVFFLRDPGRPSGEYRGEMTLNTDMTLRAVEYIGDIEVEGTGTWSWDRAARTFTIRSASGALFSGALTGSTQDFTITGTWSNGQAGRLRLYR